MTRRSAVMLTACIGLIGASGAPRAQDEGFTPLFNGKDLTGWVYGRRADGSENRTGKGYQVENGVLFTHQGRRRQPVHREAVRGLRAALRVPADGERQQRHRHPRAARRRRGVRRAWKSRCSTTAARSIEACEPAQYHGSIYQMFPATRGHQKPVGEWNSEEITVAGPEDCRQAERRDDHRGQSRRCEGRSAARQAPGPEQARRIARHRQHHRPHRPARPRHARRVPEHSRQIALAASREEVRRCPKLYTAEFAETADRNQKSSAFAASLRGEML